MQSRLQKKSPFEASRIGREFKESEKFKITDIADTLRIHRSTLYLTEKGSPMFYKKHEDGEVLPEIK
jgi:hypothetical protein